MASSITSLGHTSNHDNLVAHRSVCALLRVMGVIYSSTFRSPFDFRLLLHFHLLCGFPCNVEFCKRQSSAILLYVLEN